MGHSSNDWDDRVENVFAESDFLINEYSTRTRFYSTNSPVVNIGLDDELIPEYFFWVYVDQKASQVVNIKQHETLRELVNFCNPYDVCHNYPIFSKPIVPAATTSPKCIRPER